MALLLGIRRPFSFAVQRFHLRCFSTSLPYVKEKEKLSCMETGNKSSFIHSAAVVHPDAILGQVKVGHDQLLRHAILIIIIDPYNKAEYADCVYRGAVVGDDLPGSTVIGDNNVIGHHAVVGIKCQDLKYKNYTHTAGATVIHQFCHIGSFSFIGGGLVVFQDIPKYTMVNVD